MYKILKRILYSFVICCIFTSCITSGKVNYMQKPGFNIPSYKDSISYEDYQLRVGDRLYVKVYSTDDKTNSLFNGASNQLLGVNNSGTSNTVTDLYTYLVEDDGTINFPMVGKIPVVSKTVREAKDEVEKELKPFLKYSTVEIRVINRYFSVLGSGKSAFIPLPQEKINIFKALALAGDIGIYGDRSRVRLLRETPNGVVVKKFDLRSSDIIHSEYYYIEPNDVIYIQTINERFFSITNLPTLISTVVSTISFGVLVYDAGANWFPSN